MGLRGDGRRPRGSGGIHSEDTVQGDHTAVTSPTGAHPRSSPGFIFRGIPPAFSWRPHEANGLSHFHHSPGVAVTGLGTGVVWKVVFILMPVWVWCCCLHLLCPPVCPPQTLSGLIVLSHSDPVTHQSTLPGRAFGDLVQPTGLRGLWGRLGCLVAFVPLSFCTTYFIDFFV